MFYIEKNNKIVLFDEDKEKLIDTLALMPQYQELVIKETERPIVDFQFADTEEFQQEQTQKERERLNMLSLTAADVERAIYKAKGMDFEDILNLVSAQISAPLEGEVDGVQRGVNIDLKALKIELKANNFYRGNPYIEQVGALLGFTPKMLDEFFETNDYTKLIIPMEVESPVEEEVNADTTNTESDVQIQTPNEDSIPEE